MAEQNPNRPGAQDPEIQKIMAEQDRRARQIGAAGSGRLWLWFVIAFIVICGGIAWNWMTPHRRGPRIATATSKAVAKQSGPEPTTVQELVANAQTLEGRQVRVNGAIVKQQLGDDKLAVTSPADNSMVVVDLPAGAQGQKLAAGTHVDIVGTVGGANNNHASKQEGNAASGGAQQGVYLQASAITPSGKDNGEQSQVR